MSKGSILILVSRCFFIGAVMSAFLSPKDLLNASIERRLRFPELTSLSVDAEDSFGIEPFTPSKIERHRYPHLYNIQVSKSKRCIWFELYKNASGSIHSALKRQIQDLNGERFSSLPHAYRHYYKFAFVRNPWDRIVSFYFHKIVPKKPIRFKECFDKDFEFFVHYIKNIDIARADAHIRLQTRLIPVEQCDFIGRIDHLKEDFQHVCSALQIEMGELEHRHQSDHAHYSTYYNSKTRSIIADLYCEDIVAFGFEFENLGGCDNLERIEGEDE